MKYLWLLILFAVANLAVAESYSNASTIKAITVGTTYARVQLTSMPSTPAESCSSSTFYYLDLTTGSEIYSATLAAKLAGEKISFQLIGCQSGMPKITHVYLCDTLFCS